MPAIAERLDIEVPRPMVAGSPSELFAWPWSVVEWVEGHTADGVRLDGTAARTMAKLLRALHCPAPVEAPANPFRGVPLAQRAAVVEPRIERLAHPRIEELWRRALEAPLATERMWLHGDLHPRNVVVRGGRLRGLIDWGDLCAGDVATDLACAWTLFEAPERRTFLEEYAPEPEQHARAVGWAVNYGTGLLESGEPRHMPMGEAILRRLLEEA